MQRRETTTTNLPSHSPPLLLEAHHRQLSLSQMTTTAAKLQPKRQLFRMV
jgi:hypothetical protein